MASQQLLPMHGTTPGQSGWYRHEGKVIQFEVVDEGGETIYRQVGEPMSVAAWQDMKRIPRADGSQVKSPRGRTGSGTGRRKRSWKTEWKQPPQNPGLGGAAAAPAMIKPDPNENLPAGWQRLVDPASGNPYFYNAASQETRWTLLEAVPEVEDEQMDEGKLVELPATAESKSRPGQGQGRRREARQ